MKSKKLYDFYIDKQWDYENGFYLISNPSRISKFLSHYEIYKLILGIPGDIFEFGVYKGSSLVRWASFRENLESQHSRKIIGFDAFGKFPESGDDEDQKFIKRFEEAGGDGIRVEQLHDVFSHKNFINYELVKGDIFVTLPQYLNSHPAQKIALLHLDMDIYEPTKFALETLFPFVVDQGIIVIDDYGTVAGATRAIDEFIDNRKLRLSKLNFNYIPTFIRK